MNIALVDQSDTEEQHLGTCSNCRSGSLQPARVRSAFWHNDRLVVLEDVPALVCEECREQYYDDNTVVALDRLRGEDFPAEQAIGEISVPVFSLANLPLLGSEK